EVVFIAPAIDPITRTLLVRIQVENGDGKLVPGMFARVSLDAGSPDAVVTIDHDAVISTGRRDVVWVARGGGRFEPRIVALGARGDGGRVAVRSGIADGDAVVVSGHFLIDSESRLRGGMRMLDDAGLIADGDQVPPPPALELDAPTQARIDAILSSYLQVTTAFAADRDDGEGWTALRAAAEALASESPELLRERAQALLEATSTDAGDLATRREVLPKISAAAIAIFRAARPSSSFGAQLHVFHCPMAPIDWVQLGPQLRNPFYGSEMLECGEATGLLPLGAEGAAAMKPAVLELDAATQARVDAILRSYLQVTSAFAADQDDALGWVAMQEAARALASESPAVLRQHAQALADAIAVEANDLASRRAALPKISAAAIELFRNARPSASFGAQLHVFHCPMAPIDWVQLGPQLRNPFYGSEMLECGDAVGTLPLRAEDGK
ncbi:MAG: efflux RND transporter periplasmic adaptor subunit, partial [Planctomycetota bacterium]